MLLASLHDYKCRDMGVLLKEGLDKFSNKFIYATETITYACSWLQDQNIRNFVHVPHKVIIKATNPVLYE